MLRRSLHLLLTAAVVGACSGEPGPGDESDFPDGPRSYVWRDGKADGARHNVPYHGGRVLHSPSEVHVYWGGYWGTAAGRRDRAKLDAFAAGVGRSAWYDDVLQYTDADGAPGRAQPAAPALFEDSEPGDKLVDRDIRSFLLEKLSAGDLAWDPEAVYFVFPPPDTVVYSPWGKSCGALCGYHYRFRGAATGNQDGAYAVIPYLNCSECGIAGPPVNGPRLDQMTVTLSHELAEAVTDPDITAWKGQRGEDEIGDLCDTGTVASWGGGRWAVQDLWSNQLGRCVH